MRSAIAPLAAALAMAAALGSAPPGFARPQTPAEKRYFPLEPQLPLCDNGDVLGRITSGFGDRESEYWNSGLAIVGYDRIAEIGYRTTGLDIIPRRYCIARVQLNSGALSTVSYAIATDQGLLGYTFGVDWCIEGLDRNLARAPGCKMSRP